MMHKLHDHSATGRKMAVTRGRFQWSVIAHVDWFIAAMIAAHEKNEHLRTNLKQSESKLSGVKDSQARKIQMCCKLMMFFSEMLSQTSNAYLVPDEMALQ